MDNANDATMVDIETVETNSAGTISREESP